MFLPLCSDLALVLLWSIVSFDPRTRVGCDVTEDAGFCCCVVSIRATYTVAMATRSKIRQIQALTPQLSAQNQRNLGNLFPLTQHCARPLREKTHRFYGHLGFALELSFGLSHRHLCRGCKISVAPAKATFFW